MTFEEVKKIAMPVLKQNGVEYAAVFGSIARGENRPDSDVDILIRYKISPGLIKHIGLANKLQEGLTQKVDLITENGLNKYMAPHIKNDLKVLYGYGQRPDLS